MLKKIYSILLECYGMQGWWPLSKGNLETKHHMGRPMIDNDKFEVMVGAILTQNTSWSNVEKAIFNLNKAGMLNIDKIIKVRDEDLANQIKPSGYYNMKAKKLKHLAHFLKSYPIESLANKKNLREVLLNLFDFLNITSPFQKIFISENVKNDILILFTTNPYGQSAFYKIDL
ncbi:hypothetical protein D6777_03555, partial [Candidatus Woesearchaeota archaeon]